MPNLFLQQPTKPNNRLKRNISQYLSVKHLILWRRLVKLGIKPLNRNNRIEASKQSKNSLKISYLNNNEKKNPHKKINQNPPKMLGTKYENIIKNRNSQNLIFPAASQRCQHRSQSSFPWIKNRSFVLQIEYELPIAFGSAP